jgi:hypothetical protein
MKTKTREEFMFFIEAWLFLAFARSMLIILPFKKIAPTLGKMKDEVTNADLDIAVLNKIQMAVLRGSRYSPWRTKCFEQAIAAKIMLKKRHIKSTLYLGVLKDVSNELRAHAWLKANDVIVTGGPEVNKFTVISWFGS